LPGPEDEKNQRLAVKIKKKPADEGWLLLG
jgi:hypothetical protein